MSKINLIFKGIKNPKKAVDFINHNFCTNYKTFKNRDEIVFCINFANWKREYIMKCYENENYYFIAKNFSVKKLEAIYKKNKNISFLIWGYGESNAINSFIKKHIIPVNRMEDGFIRSMGLGANHILPQSLVKDNEELYFSKEDNRLREILNTYDFKNDTFLLERARDCIEFIVKNNISKYNFKKNEVQPYLLGNKNRKRVLVIGQVESDASILYGMDTPMTNNELVKIAYEENTDAEIYYKPHPDVLLGFRERVSDEKEVESISIIIRDKISLSELLLQEIDKVYTMTSLTGFEALIRGIEVNVIGKPFYAGWGLTIDKSEMVDRNRNLTLEELFAGSYLLYPDYFDVRTYQKVELENVLENLKLDISTP